MRTTILIMLFGILYASCNNNQRKPESEKSNSILMVDKIIQTSNSSTLEVYLAGYIDSINLATSEQELPVFLDDSQFDYRNRGIWISPHIPISVRAQILNRVSYCKPLKLIINSQKQSYKAIPKVEDNFVVPLSNLSIYDLATERLKQLECR